MRAPTDHEQIEEVINQPKKAAKLSTSKSQREEQLRQMMEDDGEIGEPKASSNKANK